MSGRQTVNTPNHVIYSNLKCINVRQFSCRNKKNIHTFWLKSIISGAVDHNTLCVAGLQHSVIYSSERYGLPLTEKIMPQYMQELGYRTHIVGKV